MSLQKFSRYAGTLIFLWGIVAMGGFFIARTNGNPELGLRFQKALVWWVYLCLAAGGFMALVGAYYTLRAFVGGGGGADEAAPPDAPAGESKPPTP